MLPELDFLPGQDNTNPASRCGERFKAPVEAGRVEVDLAAVRQAYKLFEGRNVAALSPLFLTCLQPPAGFEGESPKKDKPEDRKPIPHEELTKRTAEIAKAIAADGNLEKMREQIEDLLRTCPANRPGEYLRVLRLLDQELLKASSGVLTLQSSVEGNSVNVSLWKTADIKEKKQNPKKEIGPVDAFFSDPSLSKDTTAEVRKMAAEMAALVKDKKFDSTQQNRLFEKAFASGGEAAVHALLKNAAIELKKSNIDLQVVHATLRRDPRDPKATVIASTHPAGLSDQFKTFLMKDHATTGKLNIGYTISRPDDDKRREYGWTVPKKEEPAKKDPIDTAVDNVKTCWLPRRTHPDVVAAVKATDELKKEFDGRKQSEREALVQELNKKKIEVGIPKRDGKGEDKVVLVFVLKDRDLVMYPEGRPEMGKPMRLAEAPR